MKRVRYKKHWDYAGPGIKAEDTLANFVLDIVYLMESGIIPPLHVLNEVLSSGGNNGGMGPGTVWKPFEVSKVEYDELVITLLSLDISEAKAQHPFLYADNIRRDEESEKCQNHIDWLNAISLIKII